MQSIIKKILNIISLISLVCGIAVLVYGLTIHYSYTNIDFYENIIKTSLALLTTVLLINYITYKKLTLWHKKN